MARNSHVAGSFAAALDKRRASFAACGPLPARNAASAELNNLVGSFLEPAMITRQRRTQGPPAPVLNVFRNYANVQRTADGQAREPGRH